MTAQRTVFASCIAVGCLLVPSCQQSNVGSRTYPDAVVALQQVDPFYRPYFTAQNGANYSLADQRAAFMKAAQTARGPMPAYEARPSGAKIHRNVRKSPAVGGGRKASAAKAQGGKRTVNRGKTASSSAGKGVRKAPAKKASVKKAPVKKASKAKKR